MTQRTRFGLRHAACLFVLVAACGGSSSKNNNKGDMAMSAGDMAGGNGDMAASGGGDMANNGTIDMAKSGQDAAVVTTLPSATATKVVVGFQHSCALTSAGAVRCWGYSDFGQLGNGFISATDPTDAPVQVTGLTSGVIDIAAANNHTCAVLTGGTVMCWGANESGQLGAGTINPYSTTPVSVLGLTGVTAISAGETNVCALAGGVVSCWGANDDFQLGVETPTDPSPSPFPVPGLTGVKSVSAGQQHNCIVTSGNGLQCWGVNSFGELGQNDNMPAKIAAPADVYLSTSGFSAVSAGYSESCAITSGGAIQCWGTDDQGQLGDGNMGVSIEQDAPVAVSNIASGATSVSVGDEYACAVVSGAAKCWGDNTDGILGNGSMDESDVPVAVTGLGSGVAQIAAGVVHTCAVTTAGAVKCWGNNGGGELGDGKDGTQNVENRSEVPVAVLSLP